MSREATKLSAPDGGWGYVIMLATTIALPTTGAPIGAFGIVFGKFLAQKADGTTGVSLVASIHVTVFSLTGLFANMLLKKYSFRKVGLLGSAILSLGSLGTIFVESLGSLILTYGIIKGIGFGLLVSSVFSSFNAYFDKRMMFMMSICQTSMAFANMIIPYVINWCMEEYGYRGTLLLLVGLNSFGFPASMALQPVKWHMKKEKVEIDETDIATIQCDQEKDGPDFGKPLLSQKEDIVKCSNKHVSYRKRKTSTVPLEMFSSMVSITNGVEKEHNESFWKFIAHYMDLHLLTDAKYMNMAIGLSLSFIADAAFYPIIPPIMARIGFSPSGIALMVSTFFGADLAARITLSVASAFLTLNSRMMVLVSSAFSAGLRIVLFLNDILYYKLMVIAGLGFLRCFVQVPILLVISDNYPNNFESAYSIYTMICGVVSLLTGLLMSYTKSVTNSDIWAYHLLTIAYFITVTSWTIELLASKKKSENSNNNEN